MAPSSRSERTAPEGGSGGSHSASLEPVQWLGSDTLAFLHPTAISDVEAIQSLLYRLQEEGVELCRGIDEWREREIARIVEVLDGEFEIQLKNFRRDAREQVFLNFTLDGRPYFFVAPLVCWLDRERLRVGRPAVVYVAERRDRERRSTPNRTRVARYGDRDGGVVAALDDTSADGLGLRLPASWAVRQGEWLRVDLPGAHESNAGREQTAEVRYVAHSVERDGWRRVGLRVVPDCRRMPITIERRVAILPGAVRPEASKPGDLPEPEIERVEYFNRDGEPIRAIVDSWGAVDDATAIIIPPTWGQTKETVLPLARTLVETFSAAGEPVIVLRFDGIRRKGESFNDEDCREPGRENLHYTFSQGTYDIATSLEFARHVLRVKKILLVTFSMGSIEARRALSAEQQSRDIAGWINLVGASDLQSLMRVVSGGVDYIGGVERGVRFGLRDVNGLVIDIDRAATDAIQTRNAFLSDARRDMAMINLPVTWIHGRYDAWVDLRRVEDLMSYGDVSRRRILEIPTGHQVKSSAEALETFQLVASEAVRLATGRRVDPAVPSRGDLRRRRLRERTPPSGESVNLRNFWRNFLVGRDGYLGMELLTHTASYRELMHEQIAALNLGPGDRVVDLGAGTGTLPITLLNEARDTGEFSLIEVDYVVDGLRRARERLAERGGGRGVVFVGANLDIGSDHVRSLIPFCDGIADAVLSSLLVNYLQDFGAILREAHRLLKPGGRLVLSSMRPDADISRICVSGVVELRSGLGRAVFGPEGERRMHTAITDFVSDASRILDLEERGHFHFWDENELRLKAEESGFAEISLRRVYGHPPQAWLLAARRPDTGDHPGAPRPRRLTG